MNTSSKKEPSKDAGIAGRMFGYSFTILVLLLVNGTILGVWLKLFWIGWVFKSMCG